VRERERERMNNKKIDKSKTKKSQVELKKPNKPIGEDKDIKTR